MNSFKEEMKLI